MLQARSLCDVLTVLKHRLCRLANSRTGTLHDAQHYKEVLDDVDNRWRVDGIFCGVLVQAAPKTQRKASTLFNECYDLVTQLEKNNLGLSPEMRSLFDELSSIRADLMDLQQRHHTITDLQAVQDRLTDLDSKGVAGHMMSTEGEGATPGQQVCWEMRQQCAELVAKATGTCQDMAPEVAQICSNLKGIHNALERLRDVPYTWQDIHHYQNMVDAIDSKREDGIFAGSLKEGRVPAGQARASGQLAACYELIEELRGSVSETSPEVKGIHDSLLTFKDRLTAVRKRRHSIEDIKHIQGYLNQIETARKDGVFGGDLSHVPPGQAVCSSLLAECYRLVELCYATAEDLDEPVAAIPQEPLRAAIAV